MINGALLGHLQADHRTRAYQIIGGTVRKNQIEMIIIYPNGIRLANRSSSSPLLCDAYETLTIDPQELIPSL